MEDLAVALLKLTQLALEQLGEAYVALADEVIVELDRASVVNRVIVMHQVTLLLRGAVDIGLAARRLIFIVNAVDEVGALDSLFVVIASFSKVLDICVILLIFVCRIFLVL